MLISSATLTMSNIECYFRMRDGAKKKSLLNILKRNLLVTPFFMTNSVFKILTLALIFAIFNLWGLLILFVWSFCYTCLIVHLHQKYLNVLANMVGVGPVNALIIHPGTLPTSKDKVTDPLRYKAIMRWSVWLNFAFNTIWLLYGLLLQLFAEGQTYAIHSKEMKITLDCVQRDYLDIIIPGIWIIGLVSCLVVEIYLSKFPQLLGLNKDDDFCSTIEILKPHHENIDIASETIETIDTGLESSEIF